eukprot:240325-Pyramimonas_sp.AAC.1
MRDCRLRVSIPTDAARVPMRMTIGGAHRLARETNCATVNERHNLKLIGHAIPGMHLPKVRD